MQIRQLEKLAETVPFLTIAILVGIGAAILGIYTQLIHVQREDVTVIESIIPFENNYFGMEIVDNYMIHLEIYPGYIGENTFSISLYDVSGSLIEDVSLIHLRFDNIDHNIEYSELRPIYDPELQAYTITGNNLTTEGTWRIQTTIQLSDRSELLADFETLITPVPVVPQLDLDDSSRFFKSLVITLIGFMLTIVGLFVVFQRGLFSGWANKGIAFTCISVGSGFIVGGLITFLSGDALIIKDAWARPAIEGTTSAIYLTLENPTMWEEKLVSVTTPIADAVELHQTIIENEIARMVPVHDLVIPSRNKLIVEPSGYHLMLINLHQTLNEGDIFPITLHFASGYEVMLDVLVEWEHSIIDANNTESSPAIFDDPLPNELRIVIPEGTGELIGAGQNPEVIPDEIRLRLDEQNILTIINNDHINHTVGPFFIRAGESIRQEFTRPMVYEGGCSIHPEDIVKLIVEG